MRYRNAIVFFAFAALMYILSTDDRGDAFFEQALAIGFIVGGVVSIVRPDLFRRK